MLMATFPFVQVKDWEPKLQSILEWFGQLQQADVGSIEPAVRADVTPDNVLRDDIPVECDSRHGVKQPDQSNQLCSVSRCSFTAFSLCREELMAEVPEMENAYVKVPKIM
ncbi:TPA: hypothetical protein ACH3X3_009376 [Trebouxia sp. C0006]